MSETAPLAGERRDLRMRLGICTKCIWTRKLPSIIQWAVLDLNLRTGADALEQILSARQIFVSLNLERRCAETPGQREQVALLHRIALVHLDGLDDADGF